MTEQAVSSKEGVFKWTAKRYNWSETLDFELPEELQATVEDYVQTVDSKKRVEQALLEDKAEKNKALYVTRLNDTYKYLIRAAKSSQARGQDLNSVHTVGCDICDRSIVQYATIAAFQCVKRDLQKNGWSPVIHEECVVNPDSTGMTWTIKMTCSFPMK